jgi:hypothetical protein
MPCTGSVIFSPCPSLSLPSRTAAPKSISGDPGVRRTSHGPQASRSALEKPPTCIPMSLQVPASLDQSPYKHCHRLKNSSGSRSASTELSPLFVFLLRPARFTQLMSALQQSEPDIVAAMDEISRTGAGCSRSRRQKGGLCRG